MPKNILKSEEFGNEFYWGASISAAQAESAVHLDGKGPSIWDEFCKPKKGIFSKNYTIRNKHHLEHSADFYTHFRQDIDHLKRIGFKHFRFSIAWSRILPDGETVNQKGIDFYNSVIDYCIESGITPWITLYHWDLPQALEQKGGWTNREILKWFEVYAKVCITHFTKVRYWMIMNEPSVFVGAGYFFGNHAPGRKGFDNFFKALHHATLCIGHIYKVIKSMDPGLQVGSTFSFTHIESIDNKPRNLHAAHLADTLINRLFFEPIIGLGYPLQELSVLKSIKNIAFKEDRKNLQVNLDFIGVQTYTREVFKSNPFNPFLKIKQVEPRKRTDQLTAMNWEIYPESIYHVLKKINAYQIKQPIIITENGIALNDIPEENQINDKQRIQFYETHIRQVQKAMSEGVDVRGYFAWSLMDNFEWAEGYHPRFGLIYVDFMTKQRILKKSAYWFKAFLEKLEDNGTDTLEDSLIQQTVQDLP